MDLMGVATPYNKVPYMLCLSAGLEMGLSGLRQAASSLLLSLRVATQGMGVGEEKARARVAQRRPLVT